MADNPREQSLTHNESIQIMGRRKYNASLIHIPYFLLRYVNIWHDNSGTYKSQDHEVGYRSILEIAWVMEQPIGEKSETKELRNRQCNGELDERPALLSMHAIAV